MINPLINRYRFSSFRPTALWIMSTLYIVIVSLILFINIALYKLHAAYGSSHALCTGISYQFLVMLIFLFWFRTAYASGSAISEEINGNTYDFFRMLPLSARQKATGILIGRNLLSLVFSAITYTFILLLAPFSDISIYLHIQLLTLLLAGAVFLNSISLLTSLKINKKQVTQNKTNVGTLAVLAILVLPALFSGITQIYKIASLENILISFYTLKIPVLFLISAIALYFSIWAGLGILRRFTHENSSLFSKKGAMLFMFGFQLLLYGITWRWISDGSSEATVTFWILTLIVTFMIPFGTTMRFDNYVEQSRTLADSSYKLNGVLAILKLGNLPVYALLFILWSVFSIYTGSRIEDVTISASLVFALELFTFYAFIMLLLESYALFTGKMARSEVLIGLVGVLYVGLPLLFASVLDLEFMYRHSIIGYIGKLSDLFDNYREFNADHNVWITNLILCIPPALIIRKRYIRIMQIRRSM